MQIKLKRRLSLLGIAALCLCSFAGCLKPIHSRLVYDRPGFQVGVQTDLTTHGGRSPVVNDHPADFASADVANLLRVLEVTGWFGTIDSIASVFDKPRPIPVFSEPEIEILSEPIAQAFSMATPEERVTFSIGKPGAPYSRDHTTGALFLRGGNLYVMLTDHYAFYRADPGGGEDRDPRDFKGMKLWVTSAGRVAEVPKDTQPEWSPLEPVHLALDVAATQAAIRASAAPAATPQTPPQPAMSSPSTGKMPLTDQQPVRDELHELSLSNRRLQDQLKTQDQEMQKLKDQLEQLRDRLDEASKSRTNRSQKKRLPAPNN